eukprot:CAMPEP_0115310168 /NCGR_PEP_ID=MMETSP0270-20121206/74656_1 /TAXON_ID=71861 /ORGANISM="Scrippsiella trochoidea, Strain CCMP3099" /LENGTH=34 /DNA_ID= /DNA_START= /DNA_END= /DNA_ORIENTATION=
MLEANGRKNVQQRRCAMMAAGDSTSTERGVQHLA